VFAAEFVQQGVTANTIVPGFVDTEMVRDEAELAAQARGVGRDEVISASCASSPWAEW
jgi:NAD(P)-dependent dehydrogenase (short-subunit alcohol dehydrogenase family)